MLKITANFNQKDRIICKCKKEDEQYDFFYKPVGSDDRYFLFSTDCSKTIGQFFRERGRMVDDNSYEITIKEMYQFDRYYNEKLSTTVQRLPKMIGYVIKYCIGENETPQLIISQGKCRYHDEVRDADDSYEKVS